MPTAGSYGGAFSYGRSTPVGECGGVGDVMSRKALVLSEHGLQGWLDDATTRSTTLGYQG